MVRADGKDEFVWLGGPLRCLTGDQGSLCRTVKPRRAWDLKRSDCLAGSALTGIRREIGAHRVGPV